MTSTRKTRAAIWLRVSTNAQDEASQLPDCEAWCRDHGYDLVTTYTIHGKSAYHGKHETVLDQAITDMAHGVYKVLVVWASDRIERRGATYLLPLGERIRNAGGRIEFVKEPHLNEVNDMSEVMLAFSATMARNESKRKSERVNAKIGSLLSNGYAHGKPAFGFKLVPDGMGKRVVPDPEIAPVLREAIGLYLDGASFKATGDYLESKGILPPSSEQWAQNTLRRLFSNSSLYGRRKNAQGVTVLEHEGIIDKATFERLQDTMAARARKRGYRSPETFASGGVAVCGKCGHLLGVHKIARRNGGEPIYYLRCHGKNGESKCGVMIRVELAEEVISTWVADFIGNKTVYDRKFIPGKDYSDDIDALKARAKALDMESDWDEIVRLRGEVKRLSELPDAEPRWEETPTDLKVRELWEALARWPVKRREWLLSGGLRLAVTSKDDLVVEVPEETAWTLPMPMLPTEL